MFPLEERPAALRRCKALLGAERGKFREYLAALESQSRALQAENSGAALAYAEIEEGLVESIAALQKARLSIEAAAEGAAPDAAFDAETHALRAEVGELRRRALERNGQNRLLLGKRMAETSRRLSEMRNPFRGQKSVYAGAESATLVQVDV